MSMGVFLTPTPSGLVASVLSWQWQVEARLLLLYWGMVDKGGAAGCLGHRYIERSEGRRGWWEFQFREKEGVAA